MGLEVKNATLAALQAQSADASLRSLNSQEYVKQRPFFVWFTRRKKEFYR